VSAQQIALVWGRLYITIITFVIIIIAHHIHIITITFTYEMISLILQGWRPRRTIKFCSWGAEESGIIGSTEWVEENERELSTKAVTYINVDIAVYGNLTFQLAGSPLLKNPMAANAKQVTDPRGGNVYDRMVEVKKEFDYWDLGSGSDYASFYHFVGRFVRFSSSTAEACTS
jgi:Zn-dependent M28 family amino/carboxypeptidase